MKILSFFIALEIDKKQKKSWLVVWIVVMGTMSEK